MRMNRLNRKTLKEKYGIDIWDEATTEAFQKTLLDWYDEEKRDLPWRRTSDPYKIWVSEIMLQQTQVITVIPYYERFLEKYPTIKDLAESNEDELLKIWEGLGYYSRVKNMRFAANQIMEQFDGEFPSKPKDIQSLKGVGPYTAGAISSIAFNLPEPAVDGNLMRVLARLFEIDLDVKKQSNRKVFEAVTRAIIDQNRPGDFNQALMDLGATISTPKNYNPELSPVKEFDRSYLNETWEKYPVSSKNKKAKPVTYFALIIKNQDGDYLLEKRPNKELLANMWTFPLVSENQLEKSDWKRIGQETYEVLNNTDIIMIQDIIKTTYHVKTNLSNQINGVVTHVFSHLKWTIYLLDGVTNSVNLEIPDQCEWVSEDVIDDYVFPVVQQKMWQEYFKPTLF